MITQLVQKSVKHSQINFLKHDISPTCLTIYPRVPCRAFAAVASCSAIFACSPVLAWLNQDAIIQGYYNTTCEN